MPAFAYFISPHGFGHAARSAAVIGALHERRPELVAHLFTTVPRWFLEDSLRGPYEYHERLTDVGLVQRSAVEEDPAATLAALGELRPLAERAAPLAAELGRLGCRLAVCDVAPLGIAAARQAGIPAVLVESFTWDWIYRAYFEAEPGLGAAAEEMAAVYATADLRIQTEPVCHPVAGALRVPPVYRGPRASPAEVRRRLEIEPDRPLVLISMGGIGGRLEIAEHLARAGDVAGDPFFVAFAGTAEVERRDRLLLLPHRSPIYHPDLVAAADVVVGKLGYSTVAEAWAAGTRYLYLPRPQFPESPVLATFVREHLPSRELEAGAFRSGEWLAELPALLASPRPARRGRNGANATAELLDGMLARRIRS